MKKVISVLLTAVMLFTSLSMTFIVFAKESKKAAAITSFSVAVDDADSADALGTVHWWKSEVDGKYYVFLPSYADRAEMTVWFTASADVFCGEAKLENGKAFDFSAADEYTLTCAEESFALRFVTSGEKTPAIYINTEDGTLDVLHADKENKVGGSILAVKADGSVEYDKALDYIKGRGNSTWKNPKKPYNIKIDKKTGLFGLTKSKKFSLIANYGDNSLIRNSIVYSMADEAGAPFTPEYKAVDLYLNGEYMGSYLLTTKIDVGSANVDITNLDDANEEANPDIDLETCTKMGTYGRFSGLIEGSSMWYDIPNDPEDITGGYLLELELSNRYYFEASGFVTDRSQPIVFKSPEFITKNEVDYISDYYQRFEDAVFSPDGKNSKGEYYADLCDMHSFALMYVINEWVLNKDYGLTSTYIYKDVDGVLVAAPVWDYDIVFGNDKTRFGIDFRNPESDYLVNGRQFVNTIFGGNDVLHKYTIISELCTHADFMAEVNKIWKETFKDIANKYVNGKISDIAAKVEDCAAVDAIRWNKFGTTDEAEIRAALQAEAKKIIDFATIRTAHEDSVITGEIIPRTEKTFKDKLLEKIYIIPIAINDLFEKLLVIFGLENIIFGENNYD